MIDAPATFTVPDLPADVNVVHSLSGEDSHDSADEVLLAFFRSLAELETAIVGLGERIFPAGAVWIAWPRRAGGHESDIREQDIRDLALPMGLVDVKVAALDQDWSGLRLVWRRDRRHT